MARIPRTYGYRRCLSWTASPTSMYISLRQCISSWSYHPSAYRLVSPRCLRRRTRGSRSGRCLLIPECVRTTAVGPEMKVICDSTAKEDRRVNQDGKSLSQSVSLQPVGYQTNGSRQKLVGRQQTACIAVVWWEWQVKQAHFEAETLEHCLSLRGCRRVRIGCARRAERLAVGVGLLWRL